MYGDGHLLTTREEELHFASQFDIATIYEQNAFRLLQLPVTATDREIARRKQAYDISIKTQTTLPDGPCKLFPLDLSSYRIDINQIIDSLRDPVFRFYQEFFWFWPLSNNKPNEDPAIQFMIEGDLIHALEIWEKQNSDPRARTVSLHNLAIYGHFAALAHTVNQVDEKVQGDWESAYLRWNSLGNLIDFWSLLDSRIREVDDPRLTLNHVKNLRKVFNTIISFSNAKKAILVAESGNLEGASALMLPFSNHQRDKDNGLDILELATFANREKLQAANSVAKDKATCDPAHADKAVDALLEEGRKQLNVISAVLPIDNILINSIRADLFQNVIQSIDVFFEKTDDWEKAWELVKKTKPFAHSAEEKDEIQKRVDGLKIFGANQNYWYCKGYFENKLPANLFTKLEEARQAFDCEDYDGSIRLLETLLVTFKSNPDICRIAIHPPLALTLDRKSRELFIKGGERLNAPRPVFERMFEHIRTRSERCLRTMFALQNNSLDHSARFGQLYCMSCESVITGQYIVGETNDVKFLICPSCNYRDDLDRNAIKQQALPFLLQAKDLLKKANTLQPENKVVEKDLGTYKDILENIFQISSTKPDQNVGTRNLIPPPTQMKSAPSLGRPKSNQSISGTLQFILFILFVCVICFAINLGGKSNSFSPTSTYDRSLSTSSVPKNVPVYKSPTSQSRKMVLDSTPTPSCRKWSAITVSDKGKFVCAEGTVYKTFWSTDKTNFYIVFTESLSKFRMFIKDGYYIDDLPNECLRVKGIVVVNYGVPMIEIQFDPSGISKNLYKCE